MKYNEAGLTDREIQVCIMVSEGFSSRSIASELGISNRTVEKHRERINNKIAAQNKIDIIKYAINCLQGEFDE